MAMVRLFFLLFVAAAVVYWLVSIYSRSLRAEKLEKHWDRKQPPDITRDAYVRRGLEIYDRSFRRRLILLIYVLPFAAVFGAIYAINYM